MRHTFPLLKFAFVCFVATILSNEACAVCTTGLPKHVYVGSVASDSACTYNDIQSAINNAVGNACGLVIDITPEKTYSNQALVINNKTLTMQAWSSGVTCNKLVSCTTAGCTLPAHSLGEVIVSGQNGHSVLNITGTSNVVLNNFEIEGGCVGHQCLGGENGGGIEFLGAGSLTLNGDVITENKADNGAGIDVSASGGNAVLTLNGTEVFNNIAENGGGGIRIYSASDDKATLVMEGHSSEIWGNETPGIGGGVYAEGNATAFIAGDASGFPPVQGNSADNGGGIALYSVSNHSPLLYLYSISQSTPTSISDNEAVQQGGGIYVGENATAALLDFQLMANSASDGAAIYSAGSVLMNVYDYAVPSNEVTCSPSLECNSISDNIVEASSGGSIISISNSSGANLAGYRLIMRENSANNNLINASSNAVTLRSCLLANNEVGKHLIDVPTLSIANCTIADNTIGDPVFYTGPDGTFELLDSIIDQPNNQTWEMSSDYSGVDIHDVLSVDSNLLPGTGLIQGAPTFANESQGDFHLTLSSLGIDVAPSGGGSHPFSPTYPMDSADLDLKARDVDLPQVPNVEGPRDLGAYEVQKSIKPILPPSRILGTP